jgi:hypothetical protein
VSEQYQVSANTAHKSAGALPHTPALSFDIEQYRKYVAEAGLTPDEERRYLEALWELVVGCVDLGFHIHPVQQTGADSPLVDASFDVLESAHIQKSESEKAMEKSVEEMDS